MSSSTSTRPPSAEPWPAPLLTALSRPAFHPGSPDVTVRETHTSWVVLAGDRAWKLAKPVRVGTFDGTDLRARREVLEAEPRIHRELAPGTYLGLWSVLPMGSTYRLREGVWPEAVEFLLEMCRFDEADTLEARLDQGAATAAHLRRIADRLRVFHDRAPIVEVHDPPEVLRRRIADDVADLLGRCDPAHRTAVLDLQRFCDAFLVTHDAELRERVARGRVRDVHGDLRARHVLLEQDAPVAVVGRLPLEALQRHIDVGDDLAALLLDLERLGHAREARAVLRAYRHGGGDPGSDTLLSFHAVHRALARAKVALVEAGRRSGSAAPDGSARAASLIDLAERFAWRARGPVVLAVSGPPASGKSALGAALRGHTGWPFRTTGRAPGTDPAGDSEAERSALYRTLGSCARDDVQRGGGVVIDSPFGSPQLRAAFLEGLGPAACRLRIVECSAPAGGREPWATAERGRWAGVPAAAVLQLGTGVPGAPPVRQIAGWLDHALPVAG